jgi:hypothetical protein
MMGAPVVTHLTLLQRKIVKYSDNRNLVISFLCNRVISTFCAIIVGPIHANYYILAVKGEAFPQQTYGRAGGRVV